MRWNEMTAREIVEAREKCGGVCILPMKKPKKKLPNRKSPVADVKHQSKGGNRHD